MSFYQTASEGSLESHSAGNILVRLYQAGFNAVLLHLRGRGREPNRLAKSYHFGASDDLRLILSHLNTQHQVPDAVIGISLGGNLLLKYLSEEGEQSPLKTAVAISVPFSLHACAAELEKGFATIYSNYLLNLLKQSYRKKFQRLKPTLPADTIDSIKTLRQFDEAVTAPLNGFAGADDYYQRCSCAQFLPYIHTPTLIIHSSDDPFMTADVVPKAEAMSDAVTLELTQKGGHVGFVASPSLFKTMYWLENRVVAHLQDAEEHS